VDLPYIFDLIRISDVLTFYIMKKLILILSAFLFLSACQSTSVYKGEKENREYVSQSTQGCEVIRFFCDDGMTAFFDKTGCGCKGERTEQPVAEVVPCGIIGTETVQCPEGQECATTDWDPGAGAHCVSTDVCKCDSGECLTLESWPLQIKCTETK
jgi:hypothetical protein